MSDEPLSQSELILYQTEDGRIRIQCRFENETLWLTQVQMAELFQTSVPNINLHLKAIYAERELVEVATIKSYLIVRTEGPRQVSRPVLHYSLPAILAVGFRVRSPRGTQFRQWAIGCLNEYLVKGFTMDDERLGYAFRHGPQLALWEPAAEYLSFVAASGNELEESSVVKQYLTTATDGEGYAPRRRSTRLPHCRPARPHILRKKRSSASGTRLQRAP